MEHFELIVALMVAAIIEMSDGCGDVWAVTSVMKAIWDALTIATSAWSAAITLNSARSTDGC